MKTETYIRFTELGVALASTYMVAVTLLQTSLYSMFKPYAVTALGPLLMSWGADPEYVDLFILVIVMALSFLFWRGGREADYGKLFTLNMLMFFPAVLDFSMFNWVNLILPYEAETKVSPMWVFGVGLLLQTTYLTLRYTAIFKEVRDELKGRGAGGLRPRQGFEGADGLPHPTGHIHGRHIHGGLLRLSLRPRTPVQGVDRVPVPPHHRRCLGNVPHRWRNNPLPQRRGRDHDSWACTEASGRF